MNTNQVFILTGHQGEGKTTKLIDLITALSEKQLRMAGFVAPGKWEDNLRSGFDIVDVNTNEKLTLCQSEINNSFMKLGRFYFNPNALKFGEKLLTDTVNNSANLIVIDEIGIFELQGKLWANLLSKLLEDSQSNILVTVRTKFLNSVISTFQLDDPVVFQVDQPTNYITSQILSALTA